MSKNWRKRLFLHALLTVFLTLPSTLLAETKSYQSLDSIRLAVETVIAENSELDRFDSYTLKVQQLDNRLRLKLCTQPLMTKLPDRALIGRNSVAVSCEDQPGWKIYLQATLEVETEVPVLLHSVSAGEMIQSGNLGMKTIKLNGRGGIIAESIEQIQGKVATRPIAAGSTVSLNSIKLANVIEPGQVITLELAQQGLRVTMTGKASQSGSEGDWIRAVNLDSGKYVEGRVMADGSLSVLRK